MTPSHYYSCSLFFRASGELHPRVAQHRQSVQLLQRHAHAYNIRDYHNSMVARLCSMRRVFDQLPDDAGVAERLAQWQAALAGKNIMLAGALVAYACMNSTYCTSFQALVVCTLAQHSAPGSMSSRPCASVSQ